MTYYSPLHHELAVSWNGLGDVFYKQGSYEEALLAYESAKNIDINNPRLKKLFFANNLHKTAAVLIEQSNFLKARSFYQEAIKIYQQIKHNYHKELQENIRISFIREGNQCMLKTPSKMNLAKNLYTKANILNAPDDPGLHMQLASLFYSNNDLNATKEHYQILLKLKPNDPIVHHNIAYLLHIYAQIEKNKPQSKLYDSYLNEAELHFQEAIKLNEQVETYTEYAQVEAYTEYAQLMLMNLRKYSLDKIIDCLQKAIDLKQYKGIIHYSNMSRLTVDYYIQKLIDEKQKIFFNAHLLAHYLLIVTYLLKREITLAREFYNALWIEVDILRKNNQQEYMSLMMQANLKQDNNLKESLKIQENSTATDYESIDGLVLRSQKNIDFFLAYDSEEDLNKKFISFTGLFFGFSNDFFHETLLNYIQTIVSDDIYFQPILASVGEKNYDKAFFMACLAEGEAGTEVVKIMLEYKDRLAININQQTEGKLLTPLHHVAIKGNQELYDLLIQAGAKSNLADSDNITAVEYMNRHHQAPALTL